MPGIIQESGAVLVRDPMWCGLKELSEFFFHLVSKTPPTPFEV